MNRVFVLGLLALTTMAGCGSAAFWTGAAGGPKDSPCDPPPGVQDAVIYPAPGSTGIPDTIPEVIFASSSANGLSGYNAHLVDATNLSQITQLAIDFQPFSAWIQPIPQPATTPPFSNAVYYASMNGGTGATFPQGHQIRVQLLHGKCVPVDYGFFTVQ
jgi:hypothetical protein